MDFYDITSVGIVTLDDDLIFIIKNLYTPYYLPDSVKNNIKIKLYFGSQDDRSILYESLQYEADIIEFSYNTDLIDIYWSYYDLSKSSAGVISQTSTTSREVYIGYYNKLISLEPAEGRFVTSFSYELIS